jgi:hypothetical protein
MGTAWARHGMCDLAFTVYCPVRSTFANPSSGQSPTKPKKAFFPKNIIPKKE